MVPEGGADPRALLGLVRVVQWLADPGAQGPEAGAGAGADPGVNAAQCGVLRTLPGLPQPTTTPYTLVVDSGTGTTAIGERPCARGATQVCDSQFVPPTLPCPGLLSYYVIW